MTEEAHGGLRVHAVCRSHPRETRPRALAELLPFCCCPNAPAPSPQPVVRGQSVMQPSATHGLPAAAAAPGKAAKAGGRAPRSLGQLGSEAFAALAEQQVEASDLFFHRWVGGCGCGRG